MIDAWCLEVWSVFTSHYRCLNEIAASSGVRQWGQQMIWTSKLYALGASGQSEEYFFSSRNKYAGTFSIDMSIVMSTIGEESGRFRRTFRADLCTSISGRWRCHERSVRLTPYFLQLVAQSSRGDELSHWRISTDQMEIVPIWYFRSIMTL